MDSSSFSLTLNAVRRQLSAMACVRFELGLRHRTSGRMLLRSLHINQIILALPWLRFMNAHHHDIFVRPLFPIGLILLDDLSRQAVHQLPSLGFAPSVVLITSPGNHQAWVRLIHNRHGQPLSKSLLTSATGKKRQISSSTPTQPHPSIPTPCSSILDTAMPSSNAAEINPGFITQISLASTS